MILAKYANLKLFSFLEKLVNQKECDYHSQYDVANRRRETVVVVTSIHTNRKKSRKS
jgi:hypothetical protein